ncbi:MAG TPA: endonuclease/exonuclease/phosphatase family protein [Actinospica sp.]|nr:endonuclease/exonuclease/phosphatase family protein [Actinospica sp.]
MTGAEGDEQTGQDTPDLHVWPEFGIPAQRAEETPADPRTQPQAVVPEQPGPRNEPGPVELGTIPEQAGPQSESGSVEPGALPEQVGHGALGAVPVQGVPVELGSVPVAAPVLEPASPVGEFEPESDDVEDRPRTLRSLKSHRSRMRRQTSNGVIVLACLAVIFLVLHRFLPDVGGLGSMLETWLPWVGVPILLLFVIAAIVHTKRAIVATLVAALAWAALYGPTLLPRGSSAPAQLRIFSEDVNGNAQEATASGTLALAQHADIVALEDMYSSVYSSSAVNALNAAYTNHTTEYEFGLWSAYPIVSAQPIALGTTQSAESLSLGTDAAGLASSASGVPIIGALKATLKTPEGALTVYLVHLPQPVLGDQGFAKARDQALTKFAQLVKADTSTRIAVIGDVNVAATDRQFSQLTSADGLTSAQRASGSGFGFTWPAEFPVVRLDDVLTRGLKPLRSVVLPAIAKGQTHLPIQVDLDY